MKIRDRTVLVYDIEIFPNVFHCIVYDTEIDKYYYFEISERKNDILDLVSLF